MRRSRKITALIVLAVSSPVLGLRAVGAEQGATAAVVRTGPGGLRVRAAPTTEAATISGLADGAAVGGACRAPGQSVTGSQGTSEEWLRLPGGGFVSAAYVSTASSAPQCGGAATAPAPTTTPAPRAAAAPAAASPLMPADGPTGAGGAPAGPRPAAPSMTAPSAATTSPAMAPGALASDLATTVAGQPVTSRSWYVKTSEPLALQQAGCAMGAVHRDAAGAQRSVAILVFGGMVPTGDGWAFDLYRAKRAGIDEIGAAVAAYVDGYEACSGPDTASSLVLGFGTTTSTGQTSAASGSAFARMADQVAQRVAPRSSRVTVYGSNDIELGYVGPAEARAWVEAYRAGTERTLLYFGDAAGCPGERMPSGDDCGSAEHPEWTTEDLWSVIGQPGTVVMPGNYVTNGVQARQWGYLSRYATVRHGRPVAFLGVLSQIGACRTRPCTERVRNDAGASWQQLHDVLAADPSLGSSTLAVSDIAWLGD